MESFVNIFPSGNRTKFYSLSYRDTAMSPPSMVFFHHTEIHLQKSSFALFLISLL